MLSASGGTGQAGKGVGAKGALRYDMSWVLWKTGHAQGQVSGGGLVAQEKLGKERERRALEDKVERAERRRAAERAEEERKERDAKRREQDRDRDSGRNQRPREGRHAERR